jgi:ribosomal protein L11 methyltransferase
MSLWFEISALTRPQDVDAVAALMRDVAPGGVTIDEPVDIHGPEQGFTVRRAEPVVVRAYLPASELGAVVTEQLRTAMHLAFPEVELLAKPLYEQDWAVSWREFFGVVDSGGRIVVVPSWVDHAPAAGQVAIRLDPGQAFGTGHHETTRLCIAALEDHLRPGMTVLDVGTGSGILSIAAVKLGASSVDAMDIDPLAAEVATVNCHENGVEAQVAVTAGTLDPSHAGRYDLVVANISTNANIGLAGAFGRVVRPGGLLILSGILAADGSRVGATVSPQGFTLAQLSYERDWCLLVFRRPGTRTAV